MMQRFIDKVVLVTGAGGGLGRAFAQRFAAEGASLVLADVDVPLLEETASILRAKGTVCSTHSFDLASEGDTQKFAAEICAMHPKLDVLVNNAGLAYGEISQSFTDLSQQKWLRYLTINSIAPLTLGQALRPSLAAAKGSVINVSSMASFMPAVAYGVTKSTLNAITFGMAAHFGADGIRVNAIAPGLMETPASSAHLPGSKMDALRSQQALKLEGTADDISALGAFLASDDARFITGEIVSCDAGNRMRGWRS